MEFFSFTVIFKHGIEVSERSVDKQHPHSYAKFGYMPVSEVKMALTTIVFYLISLEIDILLFMINTTYLDVYIKIHLEIVI